MGPLTPPRGGSECGLQTHSPLKIEVSRCANKRAKVQQVEDRPKSKEFRSLDKPITSTRRERLS